MNSTNISLIKFKECLSQWTKLNEKGEQCLSQQVLGQPSKELEKIIAQFKQVLDTMIEEYTKTVDSLNLQENLKSNDDNHVSEELILMKSCVDMYDQEFMVKESIKYIISAEGFTTQQQLAGTIALWKAESYLDDEVQQKIKEMK
ncbi:hypothetical protein G6F37_003148 [Rhizopus arrhizus]|nr:hypothetical protein G6F38_006171 [Rhizopus arrhizus]KAG1161358.1 hypothetical protein G6F37_003148 [Rhizopus arrhizus]